MADIKETLKERGARYGTFIDNARPAQMLKAVVRSFDSWKLLSEDKKEGIDLIFSKIGRALSGDPEYKDNWHDIAGYATLLENACNVVKPELTLPASPFRCPHTLFFSRGAATLQCEIPDIGHHKVHVAYEPLDPLNPSGPKVKLEWAV